MTRVRPRRTVIVYRSKGMFIKLTQIVGRNATRDVFVLIEDIACFSAPDAAQGGAGVRFKSGLEIEVAESADHIAGWIFESRPGANLEG